MMNFEEKQIKDPK